jgi:hypothetical protein
MKIFYSLHSFVRRRLSFFERLLTAVGLSALLYALMQSLPVYPTYWDVVITTGVFALTLWSPVAGYFVAVLATVYPLYTVSIYVAVIFLAIAVIGQHLFIQNLGAALLTLISPLLGSIYLVWIVPLLGGLWWGPAGGALMGGFAALWGQLVAGMVGLDPDWIKLLGLLPDIRFLPERFASANSLETLLLLLDPLAPNSTSLLYHLLQIAIWAFAGWTIGTLTEKEWVQYRRPRSTALMAFAGAVILAGLHVLLSLWLSQPLQPTAWINLGLTVLFSAMAVVLLEIGLDFFDHPLPLPRHIALEIASEEKSATTGPAPVTIPKLPEMDPDKTDPDDLIMLELD